MKKQCNLIPFPYPIEGDGFFAAFSSALLPCLGITEDTPFWCNPKNRYCTQCGECGESSILQKHHLMLYHTLITVSGVAFTYDYPEDDTVGFHTYPDAPIGWRWNEPFIADLFDFAGFTYERFAHRTVAEMTPLLRKTLDDGFTALVANTGQWEHEMDWLFAWQVVCGYTENGILLMQYGGNIVEITQGEWDDWILITGKTQRKKSIRDILTKIHSVLTHPSHDALQKELEQDLENVTPENAVGMAFKFMGINGVPIETRWHAAEAMISRDNLISALWDNEAQKQVLRDLFFDRYIHDNHNETHGIGWKIWGTLNVGPHTQYLPSEESFALIQKPEVRKELKDLFAVVFENDRIVAENIAKMLQSDRL